MHADADMSGRCLHPGGCEHLAGDHEGRHLRSPNGRTVATGSLRVGLAVAYLGETHEVLDWGQPRMVGVLTRGHPGRVHELHQGQHVLVNWVGFEGADESEVVGYSTDDAGDVYAGLAQISDAEYERRATVLREAAR